MSDLSQNTAALFTQGLALHQQGRFAEAKAIYDQILALDPKHFDAMHLSGVIVMQGGDNQQAVALISKAIALNPANPAYAPAYNNRGLAYRALARQEAAIDNFDRALELGGPAQPEVQFNRANALRALARYPAALAGYDRALALTPDHGEAHYERARVLKIMGRVDQALAAFRRAAQLKPDSFDIQNQLGVTLSEFNRADEAAASFRKALQIDPRSAPAHTNLGNALNILGKTDAALAAYDAALALRANYVDAYVNRAGTLIALGRYDSAISDLERALEFAPHYPFLAGILQHTRMLVCDWDKAEANIAALVAGVEAGQSVTPSWPLLAMTDNLPIQRKAAEIWTRSRCPLDATLGPIPAWPKHERIRVGYYSADYYNHATAYVLTEFFELHDKSRFETYAFSYGPERDDDARRRMSKAFDHFIDARQSADRDVAAYSRQMEIDIAIDLKGFTTGSRPGIFACRAAPVQVNYMGYAGPMCADYLDYIIGDATVIPPAERQIYAEKVVTLPHSYYVNDSKRPLSATQFSRAGLGLPTAAFVFCCFNNNFKITPAVFASWMRILTRVPGSVLWLFEDNATAAANLRKEAERAGVDPARLVFAKRIPPGEHLARQRAADLLLDTLPYNAHTTGTDALFIGLPMITRPGNAFAARVAASLLRAAELPELIAASVQEYEDLAVALAQDPKRLTLLKQKLTRDPASLPLFDTALFTRSMEKAYGAMMERHWAGLPPDHIVID